MKCAQIDIVKVKVKKNYQLELVFEDGKLGVVDISKIVPIKGIFEPLNDPSYFSTVSVNHDIGTICWDNGADLSPEFLYEKIP